MINLADLASDSVVESIMSDGIHGWDCFCADCTEPIE